MSPPSLSVQISSLVGALFCLIAYMGHQFNWLSAKKISYNLLNAVGSGILCYLAFRPFQAGFWLMEAVWFIISIIALRKAIRSSS